MVFPKKLMMEALYAMRITESNFYYLPDKYGSYNVTNQKFVMETNIYQVDVNNWSAKFDSENQLATLQALESGKVIYLPRLAFRLLDNEKEFLTDEFANRKMSAKSIKFAANQEKIWGVAIEGEQLNSLKAMISRYGQNAQILLANLFPQYRQALVPGNTSYRPVEAKDRAQSKRHDDRLLHVDSFPSRPSDGNRILRVFTNVHPAGRVRTWRVGESFQRVAEEFVPRIKPQLPGSAAMLQLLKITKSKRSAYDHYMLRLHDKMKLDDNYQSKTPSETVEFAAGASMDCV